MNSTNKAEEFILQPNGMYKTRNSDVIGHALVYRRNRPDGECRIINEGDVVPNPKPIRYETWEGFIKAPDPRVTELRVPSAWSIFTGDNNNVCVVSDSEQWVQQRTRTATPWREASANRDMVIDQAFSDNAERPASGADNPMMSTTIMLVLAFVAVFATVSFGFLMLGSGGE